MGIFKVMLGTFISFLYESFESWQYVLGREPTLEERKDKQKYRNTIAMDSRKMGLLDNTTGIIGEQNNRTDKI